VRVPIAFPRQTVLTAQIGAPVFKSVSVPVVVYDSLVVGCGYGIRFEGKRFVNAPDAQTSDLYISSAPQRLSCGPNPVLYFPGGGVFLTNAHPQFPELNSRSWRDARTQLSLDDWRKLASPCEVQQPSGIARIDYACKKLLVQTLLFRTRAGSYVKLLLIHANGTSMMGGPYQVLSE
jgi:hypothetical protein